MPSALSAVAAGYEVLLAADASDIEDMEQHADYVRANRAVLGRYGARFLVRWGQPDIVEGSSRERQVVIEFPNYRSAVECHHDPEYEAAHQLRLGGIASAVGLPVRT